MTRVLSVLALLVASPALAEQVAVKYGNAVNLDTFQCEATVSSFVHRVCYQPDAAFVVVLLRDTYYQYCDIDAVTVADWLAAPSKGRFYNQRIKGNFGCNGEAPAFP